MLRFRILEEKLVFLIKRTGSIIYLNEGKKSILTPTLQYNPTPKMDHMAYMWKVKPKKSQTENRKY